MVKEKECISSALEDYLESIYTLAQKQPAVRITDIAMYLGISKPSVNRAVNALKMRGYVSHEPYGDIMLTEKGSTAGNTLRNRHKMIKRFLVNVLDLSAEDAEGEANRMSRNISQETVDKMIVFMEK